MEDWRPIETAPRDNKTRIILLTAGGCVFKGYYAFAVAEDESGPCDAWSVDSEDDPHPRCWTDGLCWASNEDDEPSDQPVRWMPLPPPPSDHSLSDVGGETAPGGFGRSGGRP